MRCLKVLSCSGLDSRPPPCCGMGAVQYGFQASDHAAPGDAELLDVGL